MTDPLFGELYPFFVAGDFPVTVELRRRFHDLFASLRPDEVFNLGGVLFGLTGKGSLLPLLAVMACLAWFLRTPSSPPP